MSKTNRMRIRFTTNKEGRFKGFLLSYASSITPGELFSVKVGIKKELDFFANDRLTLKIIN